jgi:hypothetical protein
MISAQVFIDLDSARRFKVAPWKPEQETQVSFKKRCEFVIELFSEIQMRIAAALVSIQPGEWVTVRNSRIYHGWHRGTTPTDERRIWEAASMSFVSYNTSRASYLPDTSFGNDLMCGGLRTPIYDTLRSLDGLDRQKMVDTSLVADLLSYSRTESTSFGRGQKPKSLALIVADDDDFFPGVVVAEKWGLPIRVLRISRDNENRHLNVKGLTQKL